jgi:hypothetical protein
MRGTHAPDQTQVWDVDPSYYATGIDGYTALDLSGSLIVSQTGFYDFNLNADDAARIYIDGSLVLEGNFNSSLGPTSASIYLTAGTHAYDAFAFQTLGGEYFNASIQNGPGTLRFAAPGVPETASWAMFIGGFGMIGTALRRRQRTNVRFA